MKIIVDDLSGSDIAEFLEDHLRVMKAVSAPESKHALDLEALRKPEVTFWTVWDDQNLIGCGALKEFDTEHAEIKSMRTAESHRGKGVASSLLEHMLDEARRRRYRRLSLETGSMRFFKPARDLYAKFNFKFCGPFGCYEDDPNSVFMSIELANDA